MDVGFNRKKISTISLKRKKKMKKYKFELLIAFVVALPFIVGFIFWDKIPELAPGHGDSASLKSKFDVLRVFPFAGLFFYIAMKIAQLVKLPKNCSEALVLRTNKIRLIISCMFTIMSLFEIAQYSKGHDFPKDFYIYLTLLMFIFSANYSYNIEPNRFISALGAKSLIDKPILWRKVNNFGALFQIGVSIFALFAIPFLPQTIKSDFTLYLIALLIGVQLMYRLFIRSKDISS